MNRACKRLISTPLGSRPKWLRQISRARPESVWKLYSSQLVLIRSIPSTSRNAWTKQTSSTATDSVSVPSISKMARFILWPRSEETYVPLDLIPSPSLLYLLLPHLRNPIPSPFHCFQFEVTEATGEEDHSFNPPLPEPSQAQLALVPHQVQPHRLLPPVI